MELCATEITADKSLFDHFLPPSASPNHPCVGRRQDQEHKQVDRTTCKGKTQTTETLSTHTHTHTHTHVGIHTLAYTHIPCMNSLLVCSGAERDSTVWFTATTSITSATAQRENTPTQRWLSLQPIYLLGDMRLFYVHTCPIRQPRSTLLS